MAMLDPSMFSMLARGMAGELPQGGLMGMLANPGMLAPMAQSAGFGEPQPRTEVAQRAKSLDGGPAADGDNSVLPANATPTVGANFGGMLNTPPAMAMPPAEGGGESSWLDRNRNLLMGLGAGIAGGGTLSDSISKGLSGAATGMASDVKTAQTAQAQNMTMQALIARGMDPAQARAIASSPDLMKAVVPQLFGLNQTDDIKEYQFAKQQGFQGSLEQWMQRKRAGAGEYGMTPIWGTDANGNPAVLQLGKSGVSVQSQLPEGFKIARDPIKVEGPTGTTILDPQTRQQINFIPKDVAGAARQKEVGEAQGKAVAAAPGDIQAGQNALDMIEKIETNPYLDRGTGLSSLGNIVPATGGYDFQNLVNQAKSGAFLQAIQQMRGLGSLSNAEGDAATRAITRLDTATSKEAFLDALNDYRKIVRQGVDRAKARLADPEATKAPPVEAPAAAPGGPSAGASSPALPRANSVQEAMKLAPGTKFVDKNGIERIR